MVTRPGVNTDIQVARFANLEDFVGSDWRGIPIELGGRGGVVQLWAIHHYHAEPATSSGFSYEYGSALSSNPDHEGDLAFGLDEFIGSPAIYGTRQFVLRNIINTTGAGNPWTDTLVIPLYGIIRPRRQIWVLYLVSFSGGGRQGIEVYYSEIDASPAQEAQVNYKYGKYRRGR